MRQDPRAREALISGAMKPNETRPLIAIVDDDLHFLRALRRLVSTWGIDAETYASGCEFIDRLEETPSFTPDCVILDLDIADMNGLEVQKYLASRRRRIPVILVTGTDAGLIRDNALASGIITVVQKPFDPDSLIRTLHEVMNVTASDQPLSSKVFPQRQRGTLLGGD